MKEYKSYSKTFSIVPHHTDVKKAKISSSKDINQYVRQFWTDMEVLESFFIVMLNNSNNTSAHFRLIELPSHVGYQRYVSIRIQLPFIRRVLQSMFVQLCYIINYWRIIV